MKAILTINNQQVQAEINEEELRAALGEEEGFRVGDRYYFINAQNEVICEVWRGWLYDPRRLEIHNAFKTEAEAHAEKMRRDSIKSRFDFIPQEDEEVWFWHFDHEKALDICFDNDLLSEWNIGNIHRTKEEAEAWGIKYAHYFCIPR